MEYQIFISYAHKNGEIAASILSQLRDLGLSVFLADRSLNASERWEPSVRSAIKNSKLFLCLLTPESKSSGWVHAEVGAAWVLEKPILPVLRLVEPGELIEILRLPLGLRIETDEQRDALIDEICRIFSIAKKAAPNAPSRQVENFSVQTTWNRVLKIGTWSRDDATFLISGEGMHNYLLSQDHYSPPYDVSSIVRFYDLRRESRLDAVNAGIVFGWTTPRGIRRYFNLLMNQERLLIELIGDRGGDAYLDYLHLDDGVPFALVEGAIYEINVSVRGKELSARIRNPNQEWAYTTTLPEEPIGRIGLRPWRSRVECEKFEILKI